MAQRVEAQAETAWPVVTRGHSRRSATRTRVERGEAPELIDRVFLDREAGVASEANCTIKADAAKRVFDVSCRGITWAIIDSGIATNHPAFIDHYALRPHAPGSRKENRSETDAAPHQSDPRFHARSSAIRNFDLIAAQDTESAEAAVIDDVIVELEDAPRPTTDNAEFREDGPPEAERDRRPARRSVSRPTGT